MTASMLRRTESVVSLVPRFDVGVQSDGPPAPTSWTRRSARKAAGSVAASSPFAPRVIAVTRIVRRRVAAPGAAGRSAPPATAIGRVRKAASIIGIINARIARA